MGTEIFGLSGAATALFFVEASMAFIVIRISLKITRMDLTEWTSVVLQPPFNFLGRVSKNFLNQSNTGEHSRI
jgi:hypothetical protein